MRIWISCRNFVLSQPGIVVALLLCTSPIILWQLTRRLSVSRVLGSIWPRQRNVTYRSREEEDAYWEAAKKYGHRLHSSDAHFVFSRGTCSPIDFLSYVPALLPLYRQQKKSKFDTSYEISLRTISKWHRMVFAGPRHPTISQASQMRKHLSTADKREIHRISRMLPDEQVFGRKAKSWTPKYRDIWRRRLARTDKDVSVFFE
ncbi:hypothetical protein MIND_00363000 [Mycena indigotica]|uniref:Uncharacterized protein n=1 Tax=Mycena indigotica TaxID=2126181 RepID=A0A8H6T3Y7_9AGAR|nr:uncharacterized protein MIND_00363000 [Mycena indigotica]KAF7309907.1 hypothetical protein MIND_00363000 [Mycena indigotica]